ncbi:hypothetical protein GTCCBUS3UF5_32250 [Geobacillus thermoleovorans CCB_US3_UF5]|uniref:Uncharacterized protein n=1 Tax=Geobacillus thermoleovorans CCB_US3_UF5 TaxID=1111068 RepID=A0ABM5ML51_GEOTH|nr:hypothetical protein GTCCBUS3UF5_32250 [Geobacillus thermoleovorans CCB_US3_UF5]GAJ57721.1 hypothetical protein B23_0927 [Geobacillus thermoleovorans B23]
MDSGLREGEKRHEKRLSRVECDGTDSGLNEGDRRRIMK